MRWFEHFGTGRRRSGARQQDVPSYQQPGARRYVPAPKLVTRLAPQVVDNMMLGLGSRNVDLGRVAYHVENESKKYGYPVGHLFHTALANAVMDELQLRGHGFAQPQETPRMQIPKRSGNGLAVGMMASMGRAAGRR